MDELPAEQVKKAPLKLKLPEEDDTSDKFSILLFDTDNNKRDITPRSNEQKSQTPRRSPKSLQQAVAQKDPHSAPGTPRYRSRRTDGPQSRSASSGSAKPSILKPVIIHIVPKQEETEKPPILTFDSRVSYDAARQAMINHIKTCNKQRYAIFNSYRANNNRLRHTELEDLYIKHVHEQAIIIYMQTLKNWPTSIVIPGSTVNQRALDDWNNFGKKLLENGDDTCCTIL